jgi:hypothetical protein
MEFSLAEQASLVGLQGREMGEEGRRNLGKLAKHLPIVGRHGLG